MEEDTPPVEPWFETKWRPAMAWMYTVICVFDFVIFPILWTIAQYVAHGAVADEWKPLTLIGGGLFHVAMGAVLGITSYGRTREKINDGVNGLANK